MGDDAERHSFALEAELIADADEKARQEAKNGLRQFDSVIELLNIGFSPNGPSNYVRPQSCISTALYSTESARMQAFLDQPGSQLKEASISRRERILFRN